MDVKCSGFVKFENGVRVVEFNFGVVVCVIGVRV